MVPLQNGCKVPQVIFYNRIGCDIAHWTLSTYKKSPSYEFQPVVTSPLAKTKFNSCSGRSQQNEPWNLLCISRLVGSVIFMYVNPWTFSKISFCQSLAETSVEQKYRPEDYETFSRQRLPITFTIDDIIWVSSEKEACSASFSYWAATGKSTGWNWPLGWKRSNEENRHLPTSFLGLFYPTLKKKWNRRRWFWGVVHAPSP